MTDDDNERQTIRSKASDGSHDDAAAADPSDHRQSIDDCTFFRYVEDNIIYNIIIHSYSHYTIL